MEKFFTAAFVLSLVIGSVVLFRSDFAFEKVADRLTAPSRKTPYPAEFHATAAAHAEAASARKRRRVGLLIK